MKRSQSWKALERAVAHALGGTRIVRAGDYSQSLPDVHVPDFPHFKVDSKYRSSPFKHHSELALIRKKYCGASDIAILVTKNAREHGEVISMSLDDFARILAALRGARDVAVDAVQGLGGAHVLGTVQPNGVVEFAGECAECGEGVAEQLEHLCRWRTV